MCGLGELWRNSGSNPRAMLLFEKDFSKSLRAHEGWVVDHVASRVIFNELVANVVEHAAGPIVVSLHCDDKEVTLRVQDNGETLRNEASPA